MEFINLNLERQDESKEVVINCKDLFDNDNKLIVILGPPGSGKSALLEYIHILKDNISNYDKIAVFLMHGYLIDSKNEILLLDGIDEYRSVSSDKQSILYEISNKLKQLDEKVAVILSCREMDWYGEDDKNALNKFIDRKATVYKILPLEKYQQIELINKNCKRELRDSLISKIQSINIFSNPQMLSMLIEVTKNSDKLLNSKTEIYEEYLEYALERNETYQRNKNSIYTLEELIKYAGYLSCFYLLAGIDDFSLLESDLICDGDIFKVNTMEDIKKSKLFNGGQFSHRTIAEFLFAKFIKTYLSKKYNSTSIEDIPIVDSFFIRNEKIPTQLRGAYSWLCSISKNDKLLKIDPYYQVINGDNTIFSPALKIKIIGYVEDYLGNLEYKGDHERGDVLNGFYETDLDDFFLTDNYLFKTIEEHKSYSYKSFLVQIILDAKENLSIRLKTRILDFINDGKVAPPNKSYFLDLYKTNFELIRQLLDEIKTKKINNNSIIDAYLSCLYPEHITIEDTVEFLLSYSSNRNDVNTYHCQFLDRTKEDKKQELVSLLFEKLYNKEDDCWPNHLKHTENFVIEYFISEIMKYPREKEEEYIYGLITEFTETYLGKYRHLKFKTYKTKIISRFKLWADEYKEDLAKNFYKRFIQDLMDSDRIEEINQFNSKYSFFRPNNMAEILKNFLSEDNRNEMNKILFHYIFVYSNLDDVAHRESLQNIAKQYGLEEDYDKKLSFQSCWESEENKRKVEIKNELDERYNENNVYFDNKNIEELLNSYNDMYLIAKLFEYKCFNNSDPNAKVLIEKKMYDVKLLPLLTRFVFDNNVNLDLATISTYTENGINSMRGIDRIYLDSMMLTDWNSDIWESKRGKQLLYNNNLLNYLYIISLNNRSTEYYDKINFHTSVKAVDKNLAFEAITEYVRELFKKHVPGLNIDFVEKLLTVSNEEIWERMSFAYDPQGAPLKDKLLYFVVDKFNFRLKKEDLDKIKTLSSNYITNLLIDSIVLILEEKRDNFKIENALAIYDIIEYPDFKENLLKIEQTLKIRIIAYLMDCFPDYVSIDLSNAILSKKQMLAHYVGHRVIYELSKSDLKQLKMAMINNEMWTNKLNSQLDIVIQKESDSNFSEIRISQLKKMILDDEIISQTMFFNEIVKVIKDIGDCIHANRDNELELFYHKIKKDSKNKVENECRDTILIKLIDRYRNLFEFTKEKHEAGDTRVDINVKSRSNPKYEVQIECKLNNSEELKSKVKTQLIDQYLVKKDINGIYLIFEFKKVSEKKRKVIQENIPLEFRDRIEVVYFDLIRKNNIKKPKGTKVQKEAT